MATMKDVAKAAGVSIATVSATLSGAAFVSAELQARVNAAVEELGYERNSMASGLKRGTSSLIGLIVSDVTNPFFTELVDCVENSAREQGYSVLLGISGHDVERESELLRLMRSHQAAGTILCPAGNAGDYRMERMQLGRMKLVAIDNASPEFTFDTVTLDNCRAAEIAVQHLISFGHRRIGTVMGFPHQHVADERLRGFRDALRTSGIAVEEAFIGQGNFRIEDAYRACKALLALPERPTALFVANNLMLIGVMQALSEAGVSVPGDMSVASIDDFPWASAFQPALTVVRQPIAEMATAALNRLVQRLEGTGGGAQHEVFAPDLVVRHSCAPVSLS